MLLWTPPQGALELAQHPLPSWEAIARPQPALPSKQNFRKGVWENYAPEFLWERMFAAVAEWPRCSHVPKLC